MQLLIIIALIALINSGAYAQIFPSGSENVEINLDVLKPMEDEYAPPAMFDAPLTSLKESNDILEKPGHTQSKAKAVQYFDPPPIPPKRPQTFQASQDFINSLSRRKKALPKNDSFKQPASAPIETTIIDNDIDADIVRMDATNVLDSIEGKDLTESITFDQDEDDIPSENSNTINTKPNTESSHSLIFSVGDIQISNSGEALLKNNVIPALRFNPNIRLEIQSFSSPNIDEKNSRRTSLTRALNIRNFLELHGIPKDRVTIRALGDRTEHTPADRADLLFFPL